jgi:hypothetical protein
LSPVIDTLHHAADLVNKWGLEKLSDGRTLKEVLTIRNVSLWDVLSPELAIYHVPAALSLGDQSPSFAQRGRPYMGWLKQKMINLLRADNVVDGCSKWPDQPAYLVLGFNDYMYRDVLQSVVERLEKRTDIKIVCLYDGQSRQKTAGAMHKDKRQSIWEHWDSAVKAEADLLCRVLGEVVAKSLSGEELSRIIKDHDRPLWRQMKPLFTRLFKVYLPMLLAQAAIAKHILRQHHPAIIISADGADPRSRIYYLLGNRQTVPALEIMFGDIVAMDAISWKFFIADRLSVTGEKAREVIQSLGVPSQLITVTGSPRYDNFADKPVVLHPDGSTAVTKKPMVLFASTLSLSAYDRLIDPTLLTAVKKAIFQAADQVAGIQLMVKPHPLENASALKRLAAGFRNISFVSSSEDIRDLTKKCDVFVTLGSTATLGALILNKLVIWPAFTGSIWWEEEDHFLMSGATLITRTMNELVNCLQIAAENSQDKILADLEEARRHFLRQWVFKTDGQASARITALAMQMVK